MQIKQNDTAFTTPLHLLPASMWEYRAWNGITWHGIYGTGHSA